jgi:hypothetical protein
VPQPRLLAATQGLREAAAQHGERVPDDEEGEKVTARYYKIQPLNDREQAIPSQLQSEGQHSAPQPQHEVHREQGAQRVRVPQEDRLV